MKVLRPEDAEAIIQFEKNQLRLRIEDEMEQELVSWHAKWRRESLEHYLALGWSFGVWTGEAQDRSLCGYFLAQTLLFYRGMTQSLWVEHVAFLDAACARQLVELAYRWARDKHLQKVLFHDAESIYFALEPWKPQKVNDTLFEIKTAKF